MDVSCKDPSKFSIDMAHKFSFNLRIPNLIILQKEVSTRWSKNDLVNFQSHFLIMKTLSET
jgi:hypothetical protein